MEIQQFSFQIEPWHHIMPNGPDVHELRIRARVNGEDFESRQVMDGLMPYENALEYCTRKALAGLKEAMIGELKPPVLPPLFS